MIYAYDYEQRMPYQPRQQNHTPHGQPIAYFANCIQLISVDGGYVPDVYHIVLHILILAAFIVTLLYKKRRIPFWTATLSKRETFRILTSKDEIK